MANKLNKTVRFYGKLANGQFAYAEFCLQEDLINWKKVYTMSFIVADSPKTARYWLLGKKNLADKQPGAITGKGDLEPLMWAKDVLNEFIENFLPNGVSIAIYGSDERRFSAYKRYLLKKCSGFEEHWLNGDENKAFLYYVKQ